MWFPLFSPSWGGRKNGFGGGGGGGVLACLREGFGDFGGGIINSTHLGMRRVGRVVRVLRRGGQLRHVDVVVRPLGVAGVDVGAGDAAGLL